MKEKSVILVVDDQPQNIELLIAYLTPLGYEIVIATNGQEALNKISDEEIDLVLLDIIMPGMDGFEVTRRIRKNHTLPIILVTALRETEDRINGIEAGCDDFISKPLDKLELLARVRSLLRIKAYNDMVSLHMKDLEVAKKSADEAREYAESIINTVREPLITLDQNLRVVSVSRSYYEFFQVKPEETIGQFIYELGDKQWDIPKLRELLETILTQNTAFNDFEIERDFSTIGKKSLLLNARQINPASAMHKTILLALEDITEKQKLIECLQNAQKLESLGILAGGIAHEFNNLMGSIFGYIDLAKSETDRNKVSEYLSIALQSIDRARALTNQLLTFTNGGAPIKKISHLFPFVEETAQHAISSENVFCHFNVPQDLWTCNFDNNQIGQVIENLMMNAEQALPQGGIIELSACNVKMYVQEDPILNSFHLSKVNMTGAGETNDYIRISIKDCGTGVPKKLIAKIFDPFFSTKANRHGLGLAACHSIVKRHKGCIDVESEMGKGSTFHVYLPASIV